jgi:hypothetical protein
MQCPVVGQLFAPIHLCKHAFFGASEQNCSLQSAIIRLTSSQTGVNENPLYLEVGATFVMPQQAARKSCERQLRVRWQTRSRHATPPRKSTPRKPFPVKGWNEALITYIISASSSRHPISREVYDKTWVGTRSWRNNIKPDPHQATTHRALARGWQSSVLVLYISITSCIDRGTPSSLYL